MAELVWDRKYAAGVRPEPSRVVHPFLVDEVHEPSSGCPAAGERDRLILGDQAQVLPSLLPGLAGRVDLVYIDPPFETGGNFAFLTTVPGTRDERQRVSVPAYRDARGLDAWLAWFYDAAVLLHELLAEGASFYVHLDAHAAHYAKVLLDEVFGIGAFQREIIWRIGWVSGFKSRARGWIRNHDTLLFYSKGLSPKTFNKEYAPYPSGYTRRDGKAPVGSGRPIDDVWNGSELDRLDSIQIMSFSREKVGYPTQKNEALAARIVRASSNPGDLVLDCFVGSGTTAVVARKLGRRFIVSDASPVAIYAARKRLVALGSTPAFAIERMAPVERSSAATSIRDLKAEVRVSGQSACVELTHFALSENELGPQAGANVTHWSQWIEEWSVDWDHRGGPLRPGARVDRAERREPLPLQARHTYPDRGSRRARVRVCDILGGTTDLELDVDMAGGAEASPGVAAREST